MTEELRKKLDALRGVTPRLNRVTDEATAVVQEVEKLLDELQIDVTAETEVESRDVEAGGDDDNGSRTAVDTVLAYARLAGRPRVCVVERTVRTDDRTRYPLEWYTVSEEQTPWPSCPRDLKLSAFTQLPALVSRIIQRAEDLAEKAEGAAEAMREMLGTAAGEGGQTPPAKTPNRTAVTPRRPKPEG